MTALQNLFANRATLPILVASTLVLAFLFRICALVLVQHVARIDRRRKKLMYRMPLTPVPGMQVRTMSFGLLTTADSKESANETGCTARGTKKSRQ
jgi:hypothetical protein